MQKCTAAADGNDCFVENNVFTKCDIAVTTCWSPDIDLNSNVFEGNETDVY